MQSTGAMLLLAMLAGCSQQAATTAETDNRASPASAVPDVAIAPTAPGALPADPDPIEERSRPIDPKSAEAAVQVVERFATLLEQGRFAAARQMWKGEGEASGLSEPEFVAAYAKYAEIHAEVGKPGDAEGGAGSIYIDVPLRLYGTLKTGQPFNLVGPVSLRRVNDVDGSTAEQRRWHIFQSALKPRP
ncbi:MAG: hypothetical protein LH465_00090 [Sphingomonas bacterium]|nr:hypothetical protein [Sphingomonas bacterium]